MSWLLLPPGRGRWTVGEEKHQAIKSFMFYFLLRQLESLGAPHPPHTLCPQSSAQIGNVCKWFFSKPELLTNQMMLLLGLDLLQTEWQLSASVLGEWKSLNHVFLTEVLILHPPIPNSSLVHPITGAAENVKACHLKGHKTPTQFYLLPFRLLELIILFQVMPNLVDQNPRKLEAKGTSLTILFDHGGS